MIWMKCTRCQRGMTIDKWSPTAVCLWCVMRHTRNLDRPRAHYIAGRRYTTRSKHPHECLVCHTPVTYARTVCKPCKRKLAELRQCLDCGAPIEPRKGGVIRCEPCRVQWFSKMPLSYQRKYARAVSAWNKKGILYGKSAL